MKRLLWITEYKSHARQRSEKRKYYFNIDSFLIKNKHIIINKEYHLRIFTKKPSHDGFSNENFVTSINSFARKKGEQHYFNIPKKKIQMELKETNKIKKDYKYYIIVYIKL